MKRFKITTETGSTYYITERGDKYSFSGQNIAIPKSATVGTKREWPINRPDPWPAVLHRRLWITSIYFNDKTHPYRIPGGGKDTSYVISVEEE